VKPGDGRALKPYRWWQTIWRTIFTIELPEPDGTQHEYAVDVDYFDWTIRLYRDGVNTATASYPVKFEVPGGIIDVNLSLYGTSRMHFVSDDGDHTQLRPNPTSGEGWRARFAHRHPWPSRIIGWLAIAILLTSLVLLVPQVIERISQIEWVAENIGTFTSPIDLPAEVNTALTVAGVIASIERALSMRNHWLIDADTWWLD